MLDIHTPRPEQDEWMGKVYSNEAVLTVLPPDPKAVEAFR
jgi:hypothetical protein